MKKIIMFLLPLTMLWGCGNFLEEYSQNEIRPTTVTELSSLLMGEAYPKGDYFAPYLEIITDDAQSGVTDRPVFLNNLEQGEGPFTWSLDMFDMMKAEGTNLVDTWERYYSHIKGCNVVLDYLDNVSGTVEDKELVMGEALALRAFYYFQLMNIYAKPYNAPGIDRNTEPGVPIVLGSIVTDLKPVRNTMAEVYAQIESDLLTAMPLMDEHGREPLTRWRVSDLFVHTLLSRMYLYQENWEKAEEHASIVLERKPALLDLTTAGIPAYGGVPAATKGVYSLESPELIWGYSTQQEFGQNYYFDMTFATGDIPPFSVSPELKAMYDYNLDSGTDRGDLRPSCYYAKYNLVVGVTYPFVAAQYDLLHGGAKAGNNQPEKGMRTAELYLNRAEANAQMFIASGDNALRMAVLADLNTLRVARYDHRNTAAAYTPVDIAAGDELLQFVRDERRRELPYEEHRWFDLRRYGMPEIQHTFQRDANSTPQVYTLEQGSSRYVLPIASWVMERNPNL